MNVRDEIAASASRRHSDREKKNLYDLRRETLETETTRNIIPSSGSRERERESSDARLAVDAREKNRNRE